MNTDVTRHLKVGRITPCAPWLVFLRAAGRGLPALPFHVFLSVFIRVHPWLKTHDD